MGFPYRGLPRDAARFLSPAGVQVAMRYELRYPFAAWVAQQAALAVSGIRPVGGAGGGVPDTFRRYEIAWVQVPGFRGRR